MHEHDLERAARYLVDHPPAPPAPVAELERRAHRRRRRRAVATGLSAAVAVAAGALVIDRGDDRQIVTTPSSQDPADATSGTTEVVEPLADHQVTVTPDWGPPGTEIRIHGSGFGDTASGPGRQPGVELFLVDIEGERAAHLGHATIDADGHFVLDTTVPGEMSSPGGGPTGGPTVPVEPGEYQISVGASASIVHAGTFVVTPPPVPAGQVVFDEPVGVVGAVVELQAGGFEDRRGEEVSAWFIFPRGPTSEIASGLVDAEGRLAIDLQVPLVLEHEHWVEPGTYFVALLPRDGPKQEAVVTTLEVGAAQVGQTYRFDHHHDCLDYVHFDRRLWVPLAPPGGAPSSQAGRIGVGGTFTVTDDARAVFATETGAQLALRAATAEEARAYDPELFECPGSGPGGIPPLDPGEARRAQEVVAELLHVRDHAVVTIAVASPDLPGAAAHWYPVDDG